MKDLQQKGGKGLWRRENLLMVLGIAIIVGSFVNSEVLGRTFHMEFLIVGAALCGVGITQLGDRR